MVEIRRATADDANEIAALMSVIAAERVHSAIDQAWTAAEQRAYLQSLPPRCVIFAAIVDDRIAGIQMLDFWAPGMASMQHVAQLGTFVLPASRGAGLATRLFHETRAFAIQAGFRKIVIQVRASNTTAQRFYQRQGFEPCGRLRRQVHIDGQEDDEILMELFLGTE